MHQDLEREHGITVSLRTVERSVQPCRRELAAEARVPLRFETPPGRQLQIDVGETRVPVGAERVRVYLFVATLGYSRRPFVQAFRHERQSAWLDGIEAAFRHFGGVPEEVLFDNARALVTLHDAATREVTFNERLKAFAAYWRFRPRACAPYRVRPRARTSAASATSSATPSPGMPSRAGRRSRRISPGGCGRSPTFGCTAPPASRRSFGSRDEAAALRPIAGQPPFRQIRELVRKVQADCAVEVDTNAYSVPWRLIGESVQVSVSANRVRIHYAGQLVAEHAEAAGRHGRIVEPSHLAGIVGFPRPVPVTAPEESPPPPPDLLRALSEYKAVAGGGW